MQNFVCTEKTRTIQGNPLRFPRTEFCVWIYFMRNSAQKYYSYVHIEIYFITHIHTERIIFLSVVKKTVILSICRNNAL